MQSHVACFNMAEYVPEQGLTERVLWSLPGEFSVHFSVLFSPS